MPYKTNCDNLSVPPDEIIFSTDETYEDDIDRAIASNGRIEVALDGCPTVRPSQEEAEQFEERWQAIDSSNRVPRQ